MTQSSTRFLQQVNFLIMVGVATSLVSCTSFGKKLKSFLRGGERSSLAEDAPIKPRHTKFSENPNLYNNTRRQYKRTTRQSLAEEAQLKDKAGSLWVTEGQGSYLFSQNIIRMIGDPMSVRIDGEPKEQLQSKANVIRKLLARLEARLRFQAKRIPADNLAVANTTEQASRAKSASEKGDKKSGAALKDFPVKSVPTRVTERLTDGNYRIRGSRPFMIGLREHKVIVTGIVRAEDFSDTGISASKLLESKFDIVSVKRKIR